MPWFDVVLGMVPDYMHGCLLGVTKTLLYKWFSSTNHKHPYFIGGQVSMKSHIKVHCLSTSVATLQLYQNFEWMVSLAY